MADFEEFAAVQFQLAAPEDDGLPLIEHLRAAERASGVTPQFLADVPPCPDGCEELWHIFNELHSCRGSTGFGPVRITYTDLDSFQRVSGTRLRRWELAAIRRADDAFLIDYAARQTKQ